MRVIENPTAAGLKRSLISAAIIFSVFSFAANAGEVLRLSHLNAQNPDGYSTAAMAASFKKEVETETNGNIEVAIYPDGQLGKEQEVLQQMKMGLVQSAIVSMGGLASVYPKIGVLDMPFAFPNVEAAHKVFAGKFGKKLAEDIKKNTGFAVLGYGDSGGFFVITNSKHKIEKLEDLKGLRLRTMTLPTHQAMVTSLGAQPMAIAWPEVYTSLETGVVDGQMNPVPVVSLAHFDEVQKYLTRTNHLYTPFIWVFRCEFLNRLSEEGRKLIEKSVANASVEGNRVSGEVAKNGLEELSKKMEISELSAKETERMKVLAQSSHEKFVEEKFGQEGTSMLDEFLAAIKDANSKGVKKKR